MTNTGKGILSIDPTAISLLISNTKTDPNVGGGFLELDAPTIAAASTVSTKDPVVLNASGVGNKSGGAITFEESNAEFTASNTPTIGTKPGQFELIAAGGTKGGSGGQIIVASGGNLTVNSTG